MSKVFPIGDVLSVTSGVLLSRRHVAGLYEILNYLTGDDLMTHQLPRAMDECAPRLLERYPWLADVDVSGITPENFHDRLTQIELSIGTTGLTLEPLDPVDHTHVHPLQEANIRGKTIVIVEGGNA